MKLTAGIGKMAMWVLVSPFIVPFRHSLTIGLHILCWAPYIKLSWWRS